MANPRTVRNRSRGPRIVTGSKRTRTKKINVRRASERFPLDFQAAITADVERQLKQLVAKFGEKKVREALDPLITKCKWNDWQCVANAIRRIAREK
ncbi:MAG: hypothetical protein DMG62_22370 [Acidobacteria bacterium]|nr:MAG: hypothetical protein DMG63_10325 [Acidobacteriota bacterium]PYY20708.1 MAG: hypothetical protein DMG62_22370 [Acidobacteriota bacterium]